MPSMRRSRRRAARLTGAGLRLPALTANPPNRLVARYGGIVTTTSNAETVLAFPAKNILAAPGILATGTGTGYAFAQSARVIAIECWLSPTGSYSGVIPFTSVSVVWYNTTGNSSGRVQSDSSLSAAAPAHVFARPETNSLSSFFFNSGASSLNVFDIVCTGIANTQYLMVDLHIEWLASNQSFNNASYSGITTTMSTGSVYYLPLDSVGGGLFRQGLPGAA